MNIVTCMLLYTIGHNNHGMVRVSSALYVHGTPIVGNINWDDAILSVMLSVAEIKINYFNDWKNILKLSSNKYVSHSKSHNYNSYIR